MKRISSILRFQFWNRKIYEQEAYSLGKNVGRTKY